MEITRYYLFAKTSAGPNGRGTVLSVYEDEQHLILVSPVSLHPNDFPDIVLRDDEREEFEVIFDYPLSVAGVNPASAVPPFVCQVKRKKIRLFD